MTQVCVTLCSSDLYSFASRIVVLSFMFPHRAVEPARLAWTLEGGHACSAFRTHLTRLRWDLRFLHALNALDSSWARVNGFTTGVACVRAVLSAASRASRSPTMAAILSALSRPTFGAERAWNPTSITPLKPHTGATTPSPHGVGLRLRTQYYANPSSEDFIARHWPRT